MIYTSEPTIIEIVVAIIPLLAINSFLGVFMGIFGGELRGIS